MGVHKHINPTNVKLSVSIGTRRTDRTTITTSVKEWWTKHTIPARFTPQILLIKSIARSAFLCSVITVYNKDVHKNFNQTIHVKNKLVNISGYGHTNPTYIKL